MSNDEQPGDGRSAAWGVSSMLHHRGALAVSGVLRSESGVLSFTPTGWLDKLVGVARSWSIDIAAIERVDVRGGLNPRLVITAEGEAFVLSGRALQSCYEAIVAARRAFDAQFSWAQRGDDLLLHWAAVLGLDESAMPEVRTAAGGVLLGEGPSTQWGCLVVADGLRFLPVGEPRLTDAAWHVAPAAAGAPLSDETDSLTLPSGARFVPTLGEVEVRRLRAAWRAIVPATPSSPPRSPSLLAQNRRHTFRARPPVLPPVELQVIPEATANDLTAAVATVAAEPRPEVSFVNPLPTGFDAPAMNEGAPALAEAPPLPCHIGELRDLSFDGACVCVSEEIAVERRVYVHLPTLVSDAAWHAKVIHCRHVESAILAHSYWLVGLQFEGLVPREREAVEHLVMEFQRCAVSR